MIHSLIWLPSVLKAAGLKVAQVDGWESRGRGAIGSIFGVICHHTVGPRTEICQALTYLLTVAPIFLDLSLNLVLGETVRITVIAAGRCNHAGDGIWNGVTNGNANFIGIEAENTGLSNDFPWPDVKRMPIAVA